MSWIKAMVAGAITLAIGLMGGLDLALQGLFLFIVLDYALALMWAASTGKFNSSIGAKGFFRKLALLVAVGVAQGLDLYVLSGMPWARALALALLTLNEAGSAVARLAAMGVPLPVQVTKALESEIARKRGGTG